MEESPIENRLDQSRNCHAAKCRYGGKDDLLA